MPPRPPGEVQTVVFLMRPEPPGLPTEPLRGACAAAPPEEPARRGGAVGTARGGSLGPRTRGAAVPMFFHTLRPALPGQGPLIHFGGGGGRWGRDGGGCSEEGAGCGRRSLLGVAAADLPPPP